LKGKLSRPINSETERIRYYQDVVLRDLNRDMSRGRIPLTAEVEIDKYNRRYVPMDVLHKDESADEKLPESQFKRPALRQVRHSSDLLTILVFPL
jgi:hypothetical protein